MPNSEIVAMFDNAVRASLRKGNSIQEALEAAAEVIHEEGVVQGRREAQAASQHVLTPEYGQAWADVGTDDVRAFNAGVSREDAITLAMERTEGIAPTVAYERWTTEWKIIE